MVDCSSEYHLVLAEGMRTKFVRYLAEGEYEQYRKHESNLLMLNKDHELLRLVVRAFDDFEAFMLSSVEIIRS